MPYDPRMHHRRSIRLPEYDYHTPGVYFLTLVAVNRECLFGKMEGGTVVISPLGNIVAECWQWIGQQYPYVELDEWVIMPNYFHAILWINEFQQGEPPPGASRRAPTKIKSSGSLIGAFKTVSTRKINTFRSTPGLTVWQRNYYEHIIRSEQSLGNIRAYIFSNPDCWNEDEENFRAANPEARLD